MTFLQAVTTFPGQIKRRKGLFRLTVHRGGESQQQEPKAAGGRCTLLQQKMSECLCSLFSSFYSALDSTPRNGVTELRRIFPRQLTNPDNPTQACPETNLI